MARNQRAIAQYRPNVGDRIDRQTTIQGAVNASSETHRFLEYQNRPMALPVIRLDINLPIYRMANFRTRTAQLRHIHDNDADEGFFGSGEENESAQTAQHAILVDFARRGRPGSIVPIMQELEGEQQRDPLLITREGVVVNGNRRLAAMRELFTSNAERFRHFSHADCAVLPAGITPEEILELEVRLQMQAETKLPYGWIEEAIAIREMRSSRKDTAHIATLMKKRPKEIETAEQALTEADIYLKDWLREPDRYERVEEAEQFFRDLAKALNSVEGDMREMKRRIAWMLLSHQDKLEERIYAYRFSFDQQTDDVISALQERLDIDTAEISNPHGTESGDDPMYVDLEEETDDGTNSSLQGLIDAFDDPSKREAVAAELADVCITINERNREQTLGNQALTAIRTANTKLTSVELSRAEPETYKPIGAQLATIRSQVERLEKELLKYAPSTSSGDEDADE